MKPIFNKISINTLDIIKEELPYTSIFYVSEGALKEDVENLFSFPVNNQEAMPFYTLPFSECDQVADTFNDAYAMMVEALDKLFNKEDLSVIQKFYGEAFLKEFPFFVDYAKHTFNNKHPAIYGRFDACFDPVSNRVKGIYEFNGDTPVMLFESVHMENRLLKQLDGTGYPQFNEYYAMLSDFVEKTFKSDETAAIVFDPKYIEDTVTCETLAQCIGEHATCLFANLTDLDYENASTDGKPFFIKDTAISRLFVLSPWEEMVTNFPKAFQNWETWVDSTYFMEPAWRWFMSNKGIWAYLTYLLETDGAFCKKWQHVPVLKSYLTADAFIKNNDKYVSKPMIGRLSSNITIYSGTNIDYQSDGFYGDNQVIFQEYHEPYKVAGRNNFILGMWMAPAFEDDGSYRLGSVAATLCIREFDQPVLNVSNERFIPHLLT